MRSLPDSEFMHSFCFGKSMPLPGQPQALRSERITSDRFPCRWKRLRQTWWSVVFS